MTTPSPELVAKVEAARVRKAQAEAALAPAVDGLQNALSEYVSAVAEVISTDLIVACVAAEVTVTPEGDGE